MSLLSHDLGFLDDMSSQVSPLGGSFILSATQWEINTFLLTISSISHTEHKIDG